MSTLLDESFSSFGVENLIKCLLCQTVELTSLTSVWYETLIKCLLCQALNRDSHQRSWVENFIKCLLCQAISCWELVYQTVETLIKCLLCQTRDVYVNTYSERTYGRQDLVGESQAAFPQVHGNQHRFTICCFKDFKQLQYLNLIGFSPYAGRQFSKDLSIKHRGQVLPLCGEIVPVPRESKRHLDSSPPMRGDSSLQLSGYPKSLKFSPYAERQFYI